MIRTFAPLAAGATPFYSEDMLVAAWITFLLFMLFVMGSVVGSFLNVCIVRLPQGRSLIRPPSCCGQCGELIRWQDNIPLLSYWLLRGRCRHCGASFSMRYFWIELLTGFVFVSLYYLEVGRNIHHFQLLYWYENDFENLLAEMFRPRPWLVFLDHALLSCFAIVAVMTNRELHQVPRSVTFCGVLLGLLAAGLFPWPWPDDPAVAITPPGGTRMFFGARVGRMIWDALRSHACRRSVGDGRRNTATGVVLVAGLGPLPDWLPAGDWRLGLATGLAGVLAGAAWTGVVRLLFNLGVGASALGQGEMSLLIIAGGFLGWQPVVVAGLLALIPGLATATMQWIVKNRRQVSYGLWLALALVPVGLGWYWIGPLVQGLFFEGVRLILLLLGFICSLFAFAAGVRLAGVARLGRSASMSRRVSCGKRAENGHEPEDLGRPFQRRHRRSRRGVHRVDQLRPPTLSPRHPRQPGPRPDARRGRTCSPPTKPSKSSPPSTTSPHEIERGDFAFSIKLEDIHTHIERALIERLGDVGRKLHTGRSRNDQVVTDVKLWVRDAIDALDKRLRESASRALLEAARTRPRRRSCPATRICSAPNRCWRPIISWPTSRNTSATANAWPIAASASTCCRSAPPPWPARRCRSTATAFAGKLGFDAVAANSLDVSSDRDFAARIRLRPVAHRPAPERLGRGMDPVDDDGVRLPRSARRLLHRLEHHAAQEEPGRAGVDPRQIGPRRRRSLQQLLMLVKGLPLAYNRDLQEDKERPLRRLRHRGGLAGVGRRSGARDAFPREVDRRPLGRRLPRRHDADGVLHRPGCADAGGPRSGWQAGPLCVRNAAAGWRICRRMFTKECAPGLSAGSIQGVRRRQCPGGFPQLRLDGAGGSGAAIVLMDAAIDCGLAGQMRWHNSTPL